MCSPGVLVTAHTEPQGQSSEFQHLQEDMPAWHVPLVPVSLPVLLSGQHVLLLEGQGKPLKSLQLERDLLVVHCQGPVGGRQKGHASKPQTRLQLNSFGP